MPPQRIYVMSVAASGKSTFARVNRFYSGYRVVDYATQLPKRKPWTSILLYLSRALPFLQRAYAKNRERAEIRRQNYFSGILELMRTHEGPVAVLGRRLPERFDEDRSFDGIAFGMVLISEEQHQKNCLSRRHEMRNPIPFMHHWTTDFSQIQSMREKMTEFAQRYNIAVFDSFELAIDSLKTDNR